MVHTYKFVPISEWPHMLCNYTLFCTELHFVIIDELLPALILKQGQCAVHQHAEFQLPLVILQVGHIYKNLPERNC